MDYPESKENKGNSPLEKDNHNGNKQEKMFSFPYFFFFFFFYVGQKFFRDELFFSDTLLVICFPCFSFSFPFQICFKTVIQRAIQL